MALEQIGVEATIQGLSSFRRGIGQMEGDVRGFGRTTDGLLPGLNSMGDSLLKIGGIAAGAVVAGLAAAGAGIVAFAGSGVKAAIDMEDQMGNIAAVMNTTKEAIQPLSDLILELGIDPGLKVTAEEAARAIELLARNGLTMQEILDGAAKSTVLLANATGAEFGSAADIATDAMSIFGIKAEDMISVVDSIVGVTTNSKFTIDDFALALRNGGAAADLLGVPLDQFNTVIAATAEEMGSGMRAGTGFRNFLMRLTPNSEKAAEAMMELGLITADGSNAFFDAQGNLKDMAEVSGILQGALKDLTLQEQSAFLEMIFGQDALGTAIGLANEGEEGFRALAESMSETDAAAAALERMDSVAGVLEIIGGVINTIQLQIGQAFLPMIRELADGFLRLVEDVGPKVVGAFTNVAGALGNFIGNLNAGMSPFNAFVGVLSDLGVPIEVQENIINFIENVQDLVDTVVSFVTEHAEAFKGAIAGIGAVLASSVIVSVLGSIAGVIGAILSPIGLLIIAAAGLGAAIKTNFGGIRDFIDKVWKSIQKSFEGFQKLFAGDFKGFGKDIGEAWEGVWDAVVEFAGNLWSMVQPKLQQLYNSILSWVQSVDWRSVGLSILTFIVNGLSNIGSFLATTIQGWGTQIQGLIQSVDWLSIGMGLVTKFLEGMSNLGEMLGTWASNLYATITEAINSIDWTIVGENVITFIGNAIAGAVGLIALAIQGIYNFFVSYFDGLDWGVNGVNLINAVLNALSGFAAGVIPVLQGWYQAFITWVQSVDWLAVGLSIVNFVLTGLANFAVFVGETLAGWYTTFTQWVAGIDWVQIGLNIVMFIIDGLIQFAVLVSETLATWWNAFADWVDSIDWHQIGYDIVTFIIDAFQFFNEEIPKTFADWTAMFVEWVVTTDWRQMAIDLIVDMVAGLAEFWFYAAPKIQGWWESIKGWFDSIDWASLAQAIIDGLVQGIANGAAAVAEAASNLLAGAIQAAKDAAGIDSPSKVFAEMGLNIGQGLIQGINDIAPSVHESILMLFDVGRNLGSIGSGFASQLKNDVFPEMEKAITGHQANFDALKDKFVGNFGSIFGLESGDDITHQQLITAYFNAVHTGNEQMKQDILDIWKAQGNLTQSTIEYQQAQEAVAALQKAQADLAFLQQQQELLDLITEHGLNASEILGGLELGLGADTQGLVEAMTRAIQAIIDQANDQLQIASPSGIFKEIGKFITTGLAEGISQTATNPAHAMESMLARMTPGVSSQAAMPSVINQPSTTTITKTATVDMTGAQISNEMDMQVLGEFILQKVAEAI